MANYHVGCGLAGIYAGTISKPGVWKVKNDVTDEAICAVADYMRGKIEKGSDTYEITWKLPTGRKIIMSLTVDDRNVEASK
jgi:hypothetical protein